MHCTRCDAFNRLDEQAQPLGNVPLADGLRGVVVQVRGDWEFYNQYLGLPRWDNVENNCWMCNAKNKANDPHALDSLG